MCDNSWDLWDHKGNSLKISHKEPYQTFRPYLTTRPLSDLLKKLTNFKWTETHQMCFEDIREALCSAPVLRHPDFTKRFILTIDASDFAVGAALSQGRLRKTDFLLSCQES